MCQILIRVNCPHCTSSAVVKNGRKANGSQNFRCKDCRRQFQHHYRYNGADPAVKQQILQMLRRNCGIRDIQVLLKVSRWCILRTLCLFASTCRISPSRKQYASVQVDELWSFVRRRKRGKYWLIYAYAPENDEIIGFVCGSRSERTVRKLYQQLENVEIAQFCTDDWKSFKAVFPQHKHLVGKQYTKNIEGVNTCLRARNRRLARRTTCFSKSKVNHEHALTLCIDYRNSNHTF